MKRENIDLSPLKKRWYSTSYVLKTVLTFFMYLTTIVLFSQNQSTTTDKSKEDALLNQFVQTIGDSIISFDASNIKQYWINNSVKSENGIIDVILKRNPSNTFDSDYLKIQLANVNAMQDCTITVISETKGFSFSVFDNDLKNISSPNDESEFLNYTVKTSNIHLDSASGMRFSIRFSSKENDMLSIKKIVLSFSNNKNFLRSPGKLSINKNNLTLKNASFLSAEHSSIEIKGVISQVFSNNRIVVSDNPISSSVTIKNIGTSSTRICVGYAVYTENGVLLDGSSFPYRNSNKLLTVVSSSIGSDKIIVDAYPDWLKNCRLALHAKEDLSDLPATTLVDGKIIEVKKIDETHTEITLDKPLEKALEIGSNIRVHGLGGAFLYTGVKVLAPDEEFSFTSSIQKNNSLLEYSNDALSRGAFYVVPLILSYSTETSNQNTVLIKDFSVSY